LFVRQIRKTILCAAALAAVALATGVSSAAAEACGQKVIDDWYDNGRVDNVYALSCYRTALKLLPDDVKSYSDAPDEINRALQDAIRKERDSLTTPPAAPETGAVAGTTSNPEETEPLPGDKSKEPPDRGVAVGGSGGSDGGSGSGSPATPPATPAGGGDSNGVVGDAIKNLGPGSADSIPVPLIIVGALALLLLAAGSAGLVARRLQERKIRPDELDDRGL
jgi:hypothetical protein